VTDAIGNNSCGLTLVPGLVKIDYRAASCAVKARIFVARKGVLARKEIPLVALLYCFKMPLQIPFLRQSYRCIQARNQGGGSICPPKFSNHCVSIETFKE